MCVIWRPFLKQSALSRSLWEGEMTLRSAAFYWFTSGLIPKLLLEARVINSVLVYRGSNSKCSAVQFHWWSRHLQIEDWSKSLLLSKEPPGSSLCGKTSPWGVETSPQLMHYQGAGCVFNNFGFQGDALNYGTRNVKNSRRPLSPSHSLPQTRHRLGRILRLPPEAGEQTLRVVFPSWREGTALCQNTKGHSGNPNTALLNYICLLTWVHHGEVWSHKAGVTWQI